MLRRGLTLRQPEDVLHRPSRPPGGNRLLEEFLLERHCAHDIVIERLEAGRDDLLSHAGQRRVGLFPVARSGDVETRTLLQSLEQDQLGLSGPQDQAVGVVDELSVGPGDPG